MEEKKEDLEQIEKQFIIGSDAENEDFINLMRRVINYAKVDKNGYVIINEVINRKITLQDKILLILTVRYLASKLQEKLEKDITISAEVSAEELAKMAKSTKNVMFARVTELKTARKLISGNTKGSYVILDYHIKDFLNKLDNISNKNT